MAAASCIIFITTIEATLDGCTQKLDWGKLEITHARALGQPVHPIQRKPQRLAAVYAGQGFAAAGQTELAKAQLTEIRQRSGRGTWAEFALRQAISSGAGYSY